MKYKKLIILSLLVSIVAAVTCNFVFAAGNIVSNDKVYDTTLNVLVMIQKYSWPVITLVFIYAMYQFFVVGSEQIEQKISGQKLIIGMSVFMVIVQCLPLFYAFIIVN